VGAAGTPTFSLLAVLNTRRVSSSEARICGMASGFWFCSGGFHGTTRFDTFESCSGLVDPPISDGSWLLCSSSLHSCGTSRSG